MRTWSWGALVVLAGMLVPATASAASPPAVSPIPCLSTLKFAGVLYLDADAAIPEAEVGPTLGETDPNPAHCGLPDRLMVFRHLGHTSSDELVYRRPGGGAELFRAAGATGFPMQDVVKWLVLVLVIGILGFAALPAILGHVRRPPIEVGRSDDDVFADPKIGSDGRPGDGR